MLVDAIVDRLCAMIAPDVPLPDLGRVAVILPGMAARRAVQRRLAERFGAVLPPKLMMPSQLLRFGMPPGRLASAMESELLWTRAIGKALETPEKFDLLFPGRTVDLHRMPGKLFAQLREELTRGGISIAEAAPELGNRGSQLAELEKLFLAELAHLGFDDPLVLDRRAASEVEDLAQFDRIILAFVPDLPHMLKKKLENFSAAYAEKLEIWVHAPESEKDSFDEFGVPLAEVWAERALELDLDSIEIAVDDLDAAVKVRDFLVGQDDAFDPEQCAVALADPQLEGRFIDVLGQIGEATETPLLVSSSTGVPAGKLRMAQLGAALVEFLKNRDDFSAAQALLVERDFLAAHCATPGSENKILAALDEFCMTRYPDDFNAALQLMRELAPRDAASERLLPIFEEMAQLGRDVAGSARAADFLRTFFNRIFHREIDRNELSFGIALGDEIELFRRKLGEFDALAADLTDGVGQVAVIELFFHHFETEMLPVKRGDFVLEGMLEIPFFCAPRIALVGINEKNYPDRIAPTAFLTDSIRRKLRLRHNGDTFARAMCHLYSLLAPRRPGDVRLFVLKHSAQKEVLKPSPLFFSGALPEAELLARVHRFFGAVSARAVAGNAVADEKRFTFDWQSDNIRFFDAAPVLAVTAFKKYLASPVDFFFSSVLHADPNDYTLTEPDVRAFGTTCHAAFERLKELFCDSEEAFYRALEHNLANILRENYGETLPVLVKLQSDNLLQRFHYAAADLEQSRREGFVLIEAEYRFGGGTPIPLGEGFVKGTADRIEYCAARNTLRILDIKTGKIDSVVKEHYQSRKQQFINLQLPLYAILLRRDTEFARRHPEIDLATVKIECGYFLLPRAVTESRIEIWNPGDFDALLPDAEACAVRVIAEVKAMKEKIFFCDPERNSLPDPLKQIVPDLQQSLPKVVWRKVESEQNE